MKTFLELITELNTLADDYSCGADNDDDNHNTDDCKNCEARQFVNSIGEDLRYFFKKWKIL